LCQIHHPSPHRSSPSSDHHQQLNHEIDDESALSKAY
jgi:hypothetical protein